MDALAGGDWSKLKNDKKTEYDITDYQRGNR